jgi:GMP synthase (glutamine-hydrolysing)
MQSGPIVSVSHPGAVHCLTIGMSAGLPPCRLQPDGIAQSNVERMRVLSITHGPTVGGGIFDEMVGVTGHDLDRWVVPLGSSPHPPSSYDAVMIFGGSMHPDQDEHFPWLEREAAFLRGVIQDGVPAIGVCLGAQLLARAAGAWVAPAPSPEIGWCPVELTSEGVADPVLGTMPASTEAFQWHHYTFGIPEGATELARSDVCTQAFRLGNAWGIQFHAEVTEAMVETWAAENEDELPTGPEALVAETSVRIAGWNELGRGLSAAFLETAALSCRPA